MQSCDPSKLRARIPEGSCLSFVSQDESTLVVSQKPSKLILFQKSDYNEDPFNLGSATDSNLDKAPVTTDFQMAKQVDLKVGTLVFLQWVEFDTEPAYVVVSNDKALIVLNKDLEKVFRNEELLGSTDLCFFTSATIKRDKDASVKGRFFEKVVLSAVLRFMRTIKYFLWF